MKREEKSYETAIIEKMRRELFNKLKDVPKRLPYESESEYRRKIQPVIKIRISKREIKKVEENWEKIVSEGKKQNVEIIRYSDFPDVLVAKYIQFDPLPFAWDI